MRKRKREKNRQKAIEERKCFVCGGFGYIIQHCKNVKVERLVQVLSNKFELLRDKVMQRGEESGSEVGKDRKMNLRKEKVKREVEVQ